MPSISYFLKTQRLGFRTWTEDDLEIAFGLWGDFEVTKLFDGRGPLSRDQVRQRLNQEIATQAAHQMQYWPIFLLKSADHVGCAGLRPYDLSKKVLEIGFHIRSNYWRQGYANEAAEKIITYAFDALSAKALFAGHHPQNKVSGDLLKKLGFRFTHVEYYEPTGRHHPSYLLSVEGYPHILKKDEKNNSGQHL